MRQWIESRWDEENTHSTDKREVSPIWNCISSMWEQHYEREWNLAAAVECASQRTIERRTKLYSMMRVLTSLAIAMHCENDRGRNMRREGWKINVYHWIFMKFIGLYFSKHNNFVRVLTSPSTKWTFRSVEI